MIGLVQQQFGCLAFALLVTITTWSVDQIANRTSLPARRSRVAWYVGFGAFAGANLGLIARPEMVIPAVIAGILGGFAVYQRVGRTHAT